MLAKRYIILGNRFVEEAIKLINNNLLNSIKNEE